MKGYTQILVAASQAKQLLDDPKLCHVRHMLTSIIRNTELPLAPRHVVERDLDSIDKLIAIIAKHGGLVK